MNEQWLAQQQRRGIAIFIHGYPELSDGQVARILDVDPNTVYTVRGDLRRYTSLFNRHSRPLAERRGRLTRQ
jgi:DNA-binding CsgD family transcriptional regulator